ncbi:hypothetical protein ACI7RC_13130 [Brevibacillus sp. B_LB10_24]|uniref:hypothetical protein n=1 Tax=Brevibacillus sp. B_LB10_24 TaxID=3380645 RepID=UPI0038B88978
MNLSTCLSMLSDSTQQAIVEEQNRRLQENSKAALAERLTDECYLTRLWQALHDVERDVVRLFLLEAAKGFLTKRQWESLSHARHARLSVGLTRLRRLGIVLTVRKLWSEVGYFVPEEIRRTFLPLLDQQGKTELHCNNHIQTLSYYTTGGRGIHLDLFACLQLVRDQQPALTKRRTIHQRFIQKLSIQVSLSDEHVGTMADRLGGDGRKQPYPVAIAVLLDMAFRLQLLSADEKQIGLNQAKVDEWLGLSAAERLMDIYRLAERYYLPHQPWLEACSFEMKRCRDSGWRSVSQLLQRLRTLGFRLPDDADALLKAAWLHPLLGFGFVQLGLDQDQELFWRWNPLLAEGSESSLWYVEPTGVVIAAPTVPLRDLWELGRLGDFSFEGEMVQCTLQPAKVQSYIGGGGAERQILSFLQSACPYPLPDAILQQVKNWARDARQIQMERCIRVRTAHAGILQELRELQSMQPFLGEIISETDFLIDERQEEKLLIMLRQCGYEPQAGLIRGFRPLEAGEGRPTSARPDADDTQNGLLAIALPWDGYQVENVFPDPSDGAPQLSRLPRIWTQHYQSYHPQTLRDLLKRAEELQLTVRVQLAAGTEQEGVPVKVDIQLGYWHVTLDTGAGKSRLRLDDIQRVRMLLPDYVQH